MRPMKQVLLLCGILSSLVYIGADIISGATWEGYSFTTERITIGAYLIWTAVLTIALGSKDKYAFRHYCREKI